MFCSKCGSRIDEDVRFCRRCGTDLENSSLMTAQEGLSFRNRVAERLMKSKSKDPDELIGNGVGSVIAGDGFFMVAVILSATNSSVRSLLWLFLLIPAFIFFGKGFADVLHARQIMRRQKQNELRDASSISELPPPRASVFEVLKESISGELAPVPSVTDRTTRDLK